MRQRLFAAAACILASGCATQDQLRQTEVQSAEQKQAVQALRADAGRSESSIGDLRAELKRTQGSVHDLEVALTDVRARADTAQATAKDFLTNLVAAREEQRRQLADSNTAYVELKRKLADLETRLQAQQRALEQTSNSLTEANRRLTVAEAGLVEAGRKAGAMEAKAKTSQDADVAMTKQLQTLQVQVSETRSIISSEGLLKLMRELQGVQRDTAALRGAIEELEHGQTEAAARAKNYYLDLDTRIQALKQKMAQQAAETPAVAPAAGVEKAEMPEAADQ
jgi:chromosome segregation ATPase